MDNKFWAYVAAFGALWGTVEITLGSFLHMTRIPLVGVILTASGVALLVAQRQLYPARGLTIATGVVAALCKSISPGGIILGPMLGIMTEALIVEIFLLLAPQSLTFSVLSGVVAALWAAFQKLVTQYIFYGATIVELYVQALQRAWRWLHLPTELGVTAVTILLAVVVLIGGAAGYIGWRLGRDARALIKVKP